MIRSFRQLASAQDLMKSWTARTIRGRYQQSILGWFWAVLQPAASVLIFAFIFTLIVPVNTGGTPYVIFSYVAMVPWTFFSSSVTDMSESLVQNMSLVTKIYFPREAIPIAMMLARMLDFGIASVLLIILLVIYKIPLFSITWLALPLIFAIQVILISGIGLLCAAANVFYRDVQPLLKLVLQLLFYACPIIYPISMVPEKYSSIYYLNPLAGIIEAYRDVLVIGQFPGIYLLYAGLLSTAIFAFGYIFFKRVEFQFADFV